MSHHECVVRKDGSKFVGDLYLADGKKWTSWQVFTRLRDLVQNVAAIDSTVQIVRDKSQDR